MSLSADQILSAQDRQPEPYNVPEWGGDLYLLPLGAADGEAWSESLTKRVPRRGGGWDDVPNNVHGKARLLVKAIVDQGGNRLFTDAQAPDLSKKNGGVINRVFERVLEISGLTDEAREAMEGEFEADPSVGSPSDSASNSDSPIPTIS